MSQRHSLKPTCGCAIDRLLRHDETYIFITGAQKQSDSPSGKSYIAYCLRIGVRHSNNFIKELLIYKCRILKLNVDIANLNHLEKQ